MHACACVLRSVLLGPIVSNGGRLDRRDAGPIDLYPQLSACNRPSQGAEPLNNAEIAELSHAWELLHDLRQRR